MTATTALDPAQVEAFTNQLVGELGVSLSAVLIHIGDELGLYRALGDSKPVTPAGLAQRTGLAERFVREWLHTHAAAGWVGYDAETATFTLPPELALLVSDDTAETFMLGGFDFVAAMWADEGTIADSFRTGEGIGWHQHDARLFRGTERFFRPGYQANLVSSWLPALDGVVEKLGRGARVADIGCGHGVTTVLLGTHYPNSTMTGFDYHDASIATARKRASDAGVAGRVTFEVAGAADFPGEYDLVCLFDCLHDMGDPVGAAAHVRRALAADGTFLLVEPHAGDRPEENHHPLGRLFYAASTMICTPASLAQAVGLGLGNQVGVARTTELLNQAGFRSVRVAAETPVNLVYEVKP
jgi:SAM-dependent methyltransferase